MRIFCGIFILLSWASEASAYTCREMFIVRKPLQVFEHQTHFRAYYTRDKIEERIILEDLALSVPVTTYLEKPTKTHVRIVAITEEGAIIGGAFLLETGAGQLLLQPRMMFDRSVKGSKVRAAVLLHEYGHALFFANMARYSSVWGEWYRHVTRNWLQNIFSFSVNEDMIWLNQRLSEISRPYQEVFADLVAVLALRDPMVMAQTIEFIDRNHQPQIVSRDFTTNTLMAHWTHRSTHDIFAPVRSFLWEKYFSKAKNRDEEAQILARVFEVMAAEINARFENHLLDALTPEMLNRRLLRALDEELRVFEE